MCDIKTRCFVWNVDNMKPVWEGLLFFYICKFGFFLLFFSFSTVHFSNPFQQLLNNYHTVNSAANLTMHRVFIIKEMCIFTDFEV